MLAISGAATEVIKQFVSSAQMPDEGGIRISAQAAPDEGVKLELTLVASPEPGDAIVEQEGANVFVERTVAPLLDDKTLDATVVEADKVAFSIVEQGQDGSNDGLPRDPGAPGMI